MKCESCEEVGINTKATTKRNGENVCGSCAADIDSRKSRTGHFCSECGNEIEEYCATHPKAMIDSVTITEA